MTNGVSFNLESCWSCSVLSCHHGHSSKYTEGMAHIQLWHNRFKRCELMPSCKLTYFRNAVPLVWGSLRLAPITPLTFFIPYHFISFDWQPLYTLSSFFRCNADSNWWGPLCVTLGTWFQRRLQNTGTYSVLATSCMLLQAINLITLPLYPPHPLETCTTLIGRYW